jgi:hypothetical protein
MSKSTCLKVTKMVYNFVAHSRPHNWPNKSWASVLVGGFELTAANRVQKRYQQLLSRALEQISASSKLQPEQTTLAMARGAERSAASLYDCKGREGRLLVATAYGVYCKWAQG